MDIVSQFCLLSILLLKLLNNHLSHGYQTPLFIFNLPNLGYQPFHQPLNLLPRAIIILHLITISPLARITVFVLLFKTPAFTGELAVGGLVGSAVSVFAVAGQESGLAETARKSATRFLREFVVVYDS